MEQIYDRANFRGSEVRHANTDLSNTKGHIQAAPSRHKFGCPPRVELGTQRCPGDALHAVLRGAGHNIRRLLKKSRGLFLSGFRPAAMSIWPIGQAIRPPPS
jgi:hypothetical protein